jgi:hypothetical protein
LLFAVSFCISCLAGFILNVFVTVPVQEPFPAIFTVAVPTFLLFEYETV